MIRRSCCHRVTALRALSSHGAASLPFSSPTVPPSLRHVSSPSPTISSSYSTTSATHKSSSTEATQSSASSPPHYTRPPQTPRVRGGRQFGSEAATSLLQKMGYGDVELTAGQLIAIQELVAATNLSQDEMDNLSKEKQSVFNQEFLVEMSDDPMDGAGRVIENAQTQRVTTESLFAVNGEHQDKEETTTTTEANDRSSDPNANDYWSSAAESTAAEQLRESRHDYVTRIRGGQWAAPEALPADVEQNPAKTPLNEEQIDRIADFYHTVHGHPEINSTRPARHFIENNSYNDAVGLYGRQVADEVNDTFAAIYDYMDDSLEKFETDAMGHSGIKRHQHTWWNNVLTHIENEQHKIIQGEPGTDRAIYGPVFACLPAEQLAVIAVHTTLDHLLRQKQNQVKFVQLASALGKAVNDTIRTRDLMKKSRETWAKAQCGLTTLKGASRKQTRIYNNVLDVIVGKQSMGPRMYVKIGAVLLDKLMQSAKVENPNRRGHWEPALAHKHEKPINAITGIKMVNNQKRQGVIALHKWVIDGSLAVPNQAPMAHATLNPMLVPPVDWATPYNGGYLMLPTKLIRGRGTRRQSSILASARPEDQKSIYDGVNAIQKVAWKINTRLYDIQTEAYDLGLNIAELPCRKNIPLAPGPLVYEMIANAPSSPEEEEAITNVLHAKEMIAAKQAHWEYSYKMEQAEYDGTSQSTIHHSKLEVALEYYHEKAIYFPYTLDFRGRAYPTTPVFNHLGRDHTRCLLQFAEKKPLGNKGYRWLKIHLANLMGYDKESLDARQLYVEENLRRVIDSAEKPLTGDMWWMDADDPWQALAIMLEIADIESTDVPHEQYLSSVPVHQDGSCNGLQHYAALGRDQAGAAAVNLIATDNDKPADVYSRICDIVAKKVHYDATDATGPYWGVDEWDATTAINTKTGKIEDNPKKLEKLKAKWEKKVASAKLNCEVAKLLDGYVDRKLVKQTVMTSVYGVTFRGARDQIENRLREKIDEGVLNGKHWANDEYQTRFAAAGYIAELTLSSIGDLFEDANAIMNWLAEVADIVSMQDDPVQWITPMGFPIMQPYRNHTAGQIRTVMQHVVVAEVSEGLPISKQRQRTAFPPNFIHSLDATHMLMTAKECDAHGIDFAAVHDSYWTQAGSIDEMNEILRDEFVKLYDEENVLEDFAASLNVLYPGVEFPEVPDRGVFELNSVKGSKYFFA